MPNRTARPRLTLRQAALVGLMDRYLKGLLDPFVSLLEVHKLMYFLKAAGEDLPQLTFQKSSYGPYSPDLRNALIRMEKHLTRGFAKAAITRPPRSSCSRVQLLRRTSSSTIFPKPERAWNGSLS